MERERETSSLVELGGLIGRWPEGPKIGATSARTVAAQPQKRRMRKRARPDGSPYREPIQMEFVFVIEI